MSNLKTPKNLAGTMLAALPVGVCLASNDGKVVYANAKVEEIFGFCTEELLGYSIEDLMPELHRKSHKIVRQNYTADPTNIAVSSGRMLTGMKKTETKLNFK